MSLEQITMDKEMDRFKSKVVEIKGQFLYLTYPISERTGKTGIFFEGTPFRLKFVGKDQTAYMFDTEIMARKKIKIPVLVFHLPEPDKIIRIQRREYVRVETAVDIAIEPYGEVTSPVSTITLDISGGGAAVVLPALHNLQAFQEIDMMLVLPMYDGKMRYVDASGRIVRIKQSENGRDIASVKFLDISDQDRQSVIQFCFERQLYMKRKGVQ
ncbi:PilZ domain-containing protein [Thalassobacillus pellis]|uniref:PilZ domain-containing protein n=1 Tax=Thalassobacillus pellis TaxID=748008 RepID=UPI00196000AF